MATPVRSYLINHEEDPDDNLPKKLREELNEKERQLLAREQTIRRLKERLETRKNQYAELKLKYAAMGEEMSRARSDFFAFAESLDKRLVNIEKHLAAKPSQ
jgi:chromosome segregation ATPase